MKFDKKQLLLYAVTNRTGSVQELCRQIEEALQGGVTCVQLREKNLDMEAFIKEAICVKEICRRYGAPLIINDSVEVAIGSGADGVHVGIEDRPVSEIRRQTGSDFIIGATAKTVEQALKAEAEGADYLGVGAVFPSPTKHNAIRVTREELKNICSSVRIPAVAIGGITREKIQTLAGCGIKGVALVSAIFAAANIRDECSGLRALSHEIVERGVLL